VLAIASAVGPTQPQDVTLDDLIELASCRYHKSRGVANSVVASGE